MYFIVKIRTENEFLLFLNTTVTSPRNGCRNKKNCSVVKRLAHEIFNLRFFHQTASPGSKWRYPQNDIDLF